MKEEEYIDKMKADDQDGFVGIYHFFYKPLLFFTKGYVKSSELAEEIIADVFMKVWTRRQDFQTLDSLRAFLYVAAKNASLNMLRDNKINLSLASLSEVEDLLSQDQDAFNNMLEAELLKSIFSEVAKLPERQRLVFNMTYQEDKTVEEIADALAMTPSAVYANRSRALHTIRQFFKRSNAHATIPMLLFLGIKQYF